MHDVNIGPQGPITMGKVDKVIGLTNWHANHLQKLYNLDESKMAVIPNGIDLSRFPFEKRNNNPYKFVYSSSPDRGLEQLLSMWSMIKNRYPAAELHIFYGWEMINKILEFYNASQGNNHPLQLLKNKIFHHIQYLGGEEAGIYQRGRVSQDELAKELLTSGVWAYPTSFMETFCITALEQQAAGVIPVVSNLAALQETVAPVYRKVDGWPGNSDYQRRYLIELAETLDNIESKETEEKRIEARKFVEDFTWESSYQSWAKLIESHI
jgi:glycosyltransferase involved in cell wall biosynthesis